MPGYPDDPECATAYSDVFTATLFGDCAANASDPSTMSCTGACQDKITNMLKKCKTETTSEKLEDGITVTRSFVSKAVNALQALGGMDCAYHLGFQDCQFETCRIGEIGTRMQKAGCTSLFLFQDYKDWYGCKKENGQPQDKKVQDACWCAALRRAHATLHTYFMRTCNVDVDTCARHSRELACTLHVF
jgi:hypothetical protein